MEYLLMARQQIKDALIDNALFYAYARDHKLDQLEQHLSGSNSADVQRVGDRCFDDQLFEAAKLFYSNIKNNAKIASCLVRLGQFAEAVESAKKANSPKTWKELCFACVEAKEYQMANVAGANIIIHPDHLEELINHYENMGCADQMIELLQNGMQSERAHIGIFTELGHLYAKY